MTALQNHTARVFFLRWLFPALAVVTLIGVVAFPALKEFQLNQLSKNSATRLRVEALAVKLSKDGQPLQLQVTNPEYNGQDDKGHPYNVTAARVIQEGMTPGASAMTLQAPKAKLMMDEQNGKQIDVQANTGHYDPAKKILKLDGAVKVMHSDGYQLNMQEAVVDLNDRRTVSNHPVTGSGPNGQLSGEKLEVLDNGDHIILRGKSKVVLTPQGGTE